MEERFFCDQERGLHGATLAEVLHVFQQGLDEYVLEIFMLSKKETKESKKRKRDNFEENFVPLTEDESSSRCVFGPTYRDTFEKHCQFYGSLLQHQSDRDIPRTNLFTHYTKKSQKNGHEMPGILIVFLVIFMSSAANKLDEQLGPGRTSAFIHVFELMLLLENFAQTAFHLVEHLGSVFKFGIPVVLYTIKNTLNRTIGCGFKIIKFHLPLHFWHDIIRFASMLNFNSATGEQMNKSVVKKQAKQTQRRKSKFELQTTQRICESIKIQRAVTKNQKSVLACLFDQKRKLMRDTKLTKLCILLISICF